MEMTTGFAKPLEPGTGVLAHVTSLPGPCFGDDTRRFIDLLAEAGVRYWQILPLNPTDPYGSPYAGISAFAGNASLLNNDDAVAISDASAETAFQDFCEREHSWLDQYAAFMQERSGADPDVTRRAQFAFDRSWLDLRAYANERGVQIIGDLPIYVGSDSADVWAHPELFQLDENGNPAIIAGCPPDDFAPEGQRWGNPIYDWDAMAQHGYSWWIDRLRRAFELYDIVRLDHFIGFAHYYSIPADRPATEGFYRPGPGIELFRQAHAELGPLPVIAEDLGYVTDEVRQLVADCGFAGMSVVQFTDDPLRDYSPPANTIAYSGTHDNQTLIGYCQSRYPERDPRETADILLSSVRDCAAPIRVFPLQDLLGLGDEARMNTPGTTEGNWTWRLDELDESLQKALRRIATT